ncbi:MAG: FKBP-type peptidyl-prolyl cis-trans isomerase [Endozoicomonas sp.]
MVIEKGCQVSLHFVLKLEDGSVVDSTQEDNPATLVVGDGNLPEGFEEVLVGLKSGDEQVRSVLPEKAFGMPNPNNIQSLPRTSFSSDIKLEEGLVMSFADAGNGELPGVIQSFNDQTVQVDFNHPLAGRNLLFEVRIVNVQPASP